MAPPIVHLTPSSPSWPAELETIEAPPEELWARGRLELLAPARRVAVVGSRSPTPYGEAQARRFGEGLARAGGTVVSGLARGVDQAAHAGALEAGGGCIAVLGSGVDRPWPGGPLAERLAREGLLLSEYRPGTPPRRHHFPLRNRLIAGLADAVLVVEAAHASGSLITARWAADQGREVFAVPGRVDHPMSRGTLRLVREGATPVGSPEELLADLYGLLGTAKAAAETEAGGPAPEGLEGLDGAIVAALRGETPTVDELAERLGQPVGALLARLVELELSGIVARAPGGLYRLVAPG